MAYLAPAGTRLSIAEIACGLASGWSQGDAGAALGQALCEISGSKAAWPVVSGRAAMTLTLRAMARNGNAGRRQVIVPAYTCYSVPAAIERAGLVPVPCDVDPDTLSLDPGHLERLANAETLAVVTANLFGLPNALSEIEHFARQRDIGMLDDAAQAMGARLEGRPVGGFGDAGIFSFDKGKNISTMQGGAIVVRNGSLAPVLESEWRALEPARITDTFMTVAKLPPYALLLRPTGYGLVRHLPMLRLGETRYETQYPVTRLSRGLAALALRQVARLADYQSTRIRHAASLREALDGLPGLAFFRPLPSAEPAWPRFALKAESAGLRQRLLQAFDRAGIGATPFYPRALPDVPQVAQLMPGGDHAYWGARMIADTILTLPTHAYCPDDYVARVRAVAIDAVSR